MPIKVTCEKCGGVLHAPDDAGGKKGRCPNCQNVLPIPFESPRGAGSTYPLPTGLSPTTTVPNPPAGMAFGGATNPAGGAFPSADAKRAAPPFGAGARLDPPGQASSTPGLAPPGKTSSLSRASAPFGSRPTASAAVPIIPETGDWRAAAGGLRCVQIAVVFFLLAILLPCAAAIYAVNGGQALADKPGLIKMLNLPLLAEIRIGSLLIPAALGVLCLLYGRLRFGSVPRSSCARGPAKLGALFTLLAICGLAAYVTMTSIGMKDHFVPDFNPSAEDLKANLPIAKRVTGYVDRVLLNSDEVPGQVQRFGLLAFLVFGKLAELFFGCSLGRVAAATKNLPAAGRVTRCYLYWAFLAVAVVFGIAAFEFYGVSQATSNWGPKWFAMPEGTRTAIVGGTVGAVVLLLAIAYLRMLGGVRRACREAAT